MTQTANNMAAYIWSLADLLRGEFKRSQYGRIILPFTLLRRLEGVLEETKTAVLTKHQEVKDLSEVAQEKFLLDATGGLTFFNISRMDLTKMGETDVKDNLESYIQGFSKNARDIFEYFNFNEFIAQLNDCNLLYKVVQRVSNTDLSPQKISNHEMGLIFEELIRRFAESSNETAGEHFTPRDIVRLTTSLVFMDDDVALTKDGIIRTIYDPTAGTGGFLSSAMEYVYELNPKARMVAFGQELNPESYAICKGDMLIKGQDIKNIKLGNTLSEDQLPDKKFDYMLSNPPFGVDWKKIEGDIKEEHEGKGFEARFGPGVPRVSDGSLLFLLHLISKMRDSEDGSRIGIILNGSPLFTGGVGSGESEIRRHALEMDLLETIVALPTDMFYNTGIATYIWVLSNRKSPQRQGKVQLVNGVNLYSKMRKSLGSKRNEMSEDDIKIITTSVGKFAVEMHELDKLQEPKSNRGRQAQSKSSEPAKTFASKIFANHEFGYRRITIERPLRESYQFSDERIATLRFAPKPLYDVMEWIYTEYGKQWQDDNDCELYGVLDEHAKDIRAHIKKHFKGLKEKHIKDVLHRDMWLTQKQMLLQAKELQQVIGNQQHDDMNDYDKVLKKTGIKLDSKTKKQITNAVSWKNPEAQKVIKKIHKNTAANPFYGLFEVNGKVIEYKADSELRDYENVALDPTRKVDEVNEAYFTSEVLPHVPEAWIDGEKKDSRDGEVGIVGYEIPFNRHFYVYQPPRDLAEIDADLDKVSAEIMKLLREVHS